MDYDEMENDHVNYHKNIELEKKRKKKKTIDNAYCFYFVKENKLYYNFPISLKESLVGFSKTFKDPFGNEHTIISNNIIKQNDGYRILDNLFLLFEIVENLLNCSIPIAAIILLI